RRRTLTSSFFSDHSIIVLNFSSLTFILFGSVLLCRTTVWVFAMARHLKTVSRKYAQKLIVVQMFNYFRQSCYCKYHVSGSLFYVK
ncbi:hypothetical protein, partial [Riemerella anatipestifer]|uniref:hypothetical protein n=1 Tax=Riemerella anatipestifer TaxID=34085 RepID=UPI00210AE151